MDILNIDCDNIFDLIEITDYFREGSAYVFKCYTITKLRLDGYSVKKNKKLILKICSICDDIYMNNVFFEEKKNLDIFNILKKNNISRSYPTAYYYKTCFLYNETIENYMDKYNFLTKLGMYNIPDELFHYANNEKYNLKNNYEKKLLDDTKEYLKLQKYDFICKISELMDKTISDTLYNIGFDFNFIIMDYIPGHSLENKKIPINNKILFELIYNRITSISILGKYFEDENYGNILLSKCSNPFLYQINDNYYYFNKGEYFVSFIDAQTLGSANINNVHKFIPMQIGGFDFTDKEYIFEYISEIKNSNIDTILNEIFPKIFYKNLVINQQELERIKQNKELISLKFIYKN